MRQYPALLADFDDPNWLSDDRRPRDVIDGARARAHLRLESSDDLGAARLNDPLWPAEDGSGRRRS